MRILYLHQYFRKPQEAGSHRSYYIAKALCEVGHQVEIIAATNQEKDFSEEISPNLWVHYLASPYKQSMSFWQRIFAFFQFAFKAIVKARYISYDKIYASSTPLTIGLIALWLKITHKKKYIFEVRDLWPQVPIEMGILKNPILKRLSYFLEKKIYQNAEQIVVLSPMMQSYIETRMPQKKVHCIPNMADCDFFEPREPLAEKFNIIYMGSIGLANGLERVIDWAEKCTWASFWIVGEGAKKTEIENLVKEKNLKNVLFFPHQPKNELKNLLAQAQAVVISFAHYKVLEACSPNKFFDALAAGKICISNTSGWIRDLIEANQCGFYADSSEDFEAKLKIIVQNPKIIAYMQVNARKLAENRFNKNQLCRQVVDLFREAT
jgi:glycosyltransferase involved in cell wall biosynthesis